MSCNHHHERFCPACENGAYGSSVAPMGAYGTAGGRYSRNTVRAIAAEKKRVETRKKEVLSLKQRLDSLDREQLELYHTILQNERLAALDTLRHYAQEANADIQAAKDQMAEVDRTNAKKGYFGVARLKEDVEAANKSVYRLRSEVTAASAELLEVIALEDNEPEPEPSPVKTLRISNRGDIDVTFDQGQQQQQGYGSASGYGAVPHTPPPRFTATIGGGGHQQPFTATIDGGGGYQQPFSVSVNSAPPKLSSHYSPRPPPSPVVYHQYDRPSFGRSPATDRFMHTASPRLRSLLPAHRQLRVSINPAGSVGYNVHEAADPLLPKGYTVPVAAESPGMSPRLRNPGADRSYRPEAQESEYAASLMPSRAPQYAPPRPRSPVRNLHISNRGDVDITLDQSGNVGGGAWHSGGGSRAGAPTSSFGGGGTTVRITTPSRRPSPAMVNRSINDSIRNSAASQGPMSQSIFYDAPRARSSPVGAEEFNRRYNDSVNATGL